MKFKNFVLGWGGKQFVQKLEACIDIRAVFLQHHQFSAYSGRVGIFFF
jgi:hypothetical protein